MRGSFLPLRLSCSRVSGRLLFHQLLNAVDHRVGILARRDQQLQLIPHPLPRSREVEEVSFNREAIYKRDATPCRMAGVRPVAGLEEHRLQQPDLDYLTGHTVDLNPVAHPNSIPSHQDEPTEE